MKATTTPAGTPPPEFRQHVKSISHQSSVFLLGTLFTAAAGYFFKIYLARVLGAEALGVYALGMTVVGVAGILAAAGLPQSASRFVAVYSATGETKKLGRFLWSGLTILTISNLVVGAIVLAVRGKVAGPLYHTAALFSTMPYFVAIMLTGSLTTFLGQALAGFKDIARRTVITAFFATAANIVITIILLTMGFGLKGYLLAQIASATIVLMLLATTVWSQTPPAARSPSIGPQSLEREVVSFSVVLFGVQGFEFLLGQTDKVLLGFYLNARDVGIYSVASALVAVVPLALQSVNQIFSPMIAELHTRRQMEMLARLFRSLVKWTLGLTIPLAVVMIMFAKPLMEIFGAEFAVGWPVVVVGALGQLVNCGVGSVGYLLLMSGKQTQLLRIQGVMAIALIVMNLLLIPRMGLMGAALASAAVTIASNLWYLAQVHRSLGITPSARKYGALLAPTAAMIASELAFRQFVAASFGRWGQILAALVIAFVVFLGVSLLTALDMDDRDIARAAWSKVTGPVATGAE